jgi:hypothetical protein
MKSPLWAAACHGHVEILKETVGSRLFYEQYTHKQASLCMKEAARQGHINVIRLLTHPRQSRDTSDPRLPQDDTEDFGLSWHEREWWLISNVLERCLEAAIKHGQHTVVREMLDPNFMGEERYHRLADPKNL